MTDHRINVKKAATLTGRHPETVREAIRDGRISSARKAGASWTMAQREVLEVFPSAPAPEATGGPPRPRGRASSAEPAPPVFVAFTEVNCSHAGLHHWIQFRDRTELENWLARLFGDLIEDLEHDDRLDCWPEEIRQNRPPPSIVREAVLGALEKLSPK